MEDVSYIDALVSQYVSCYRGIDDVSQLPQGILSDEEVLYFWNAYKDTEIEHLNFFISSLEKGLKEVRDMCYCNKAKVVEIYPEIGLKEELPDELLELLGYDVEEQFVKISVSGPAKRLRQVYTVCEKYGIEYKVA